jgi:hypothetical protein
LPQGPAPQKIGNGCFVHAELDLARRIIGVAVLAGLAFVTFDEMADAHRYLEQSGQFGKIVVTV